MSELKTLILKKPNILRIVRNSNSKMKQLNPMREVVIFDSEDVEFLKENYKKVRIVNTQNVLSNNRTVAEITLKDGVKIERNSDYFVKLWGQSQYEVLFMALCSVLSQELRVRGLMALLTEKQTDNVMAGETKHVSCQTEKIVEFKDELKSKKRTRKVLTPYVIQEVPKDLEPPVKIKKVVVDPFQMRNHFRNELNLKSSDLKDKSVIEMGLSNEKQQICQENIEITSQSGTISSANSNVIEKAQNVTGFNPEIVKTSLNPNQNNTINGDSTKTLPELNIPPDLHNENTNDSLSSSWFSIKSSMIDRYMDRISHFTDNIKKNESESDLDRPMKYFRMVMGSGKVEYLPCQDVFHIATADNLKCLDTEERSKLMKIQCEIDFKYCLTKLDEDGYLPIHMAVIQDDIPLLRRQCFALNKMDQSVDIIADGLTPLQLSLYQETTLAASLLLQNGANPLLSNESHVTSIHAAAELNTDHLSVLLAHCKGNARSIMLSNAELMFDGWSQLSDEKLSAYLMNRICKTIDDKGNTPLMLSCKLGVYENVRLLLEACPSAVNIQMPTSGNTALYIAVMAAADAAAESCNVNKVLDKFRRTIECLLDHGADPEIENHSNINTITLLKESRNKELCVLIANKVTFKNFFEDEPLKDFDKFILIKDPTGNINITELEKKCRKDATKLDPVSNSTPVKSNSTPVESNFVSNSTSVKSNLVSNSTSIKSNFVSNSTSVKSNFVSNSTSVKSNLVSNSTPVKSNSPEFNNKNNSTNKNITHTVNSGKTIKLAKSNGGIVKINKSNILPTNMRKLASNMTKLASNLTKKTVNPIIVNSYSVNWAKMKGNLNENNTVTGKPILPQSTLNLPKPTTNLINTNVSLAKPGAILSKSDASMSKSDASMSKSDASMSKSDASMSKSDASLSKLNANTSNICSKATKITASPTDIIINSNKSANTNISKIIKQNDNKSKPIILESKIIVTNKQ